MHDTAEAARECFFHPHHSMLRSGVPPMADDFENDLSERTFVPLADAPGL